MNSVENKNLFDDIRRRCNSNWNGYAPFESLSNDELFELITLLSFAGSELEKRVSKLESESDKKYENFS